MSTKDILVNFTPSELHILIIKMQDGTYPDILEKLNAASEQHYEFGFWHLVGCDIRAGRFKHAFRRVKLQLSKVYFLASKAQ